MRKDKNIQALFLNQWWREQSVFGNKVWKPAAKLFLSTFLPEEADRFTGSPVVLCGSLPTIIVVEKYIRMPRKIVAYRIK